MAGPSGFVKRFKGKVAFPVGGIWVGGVSIADSAADLNTSVGWGTVQTSTGSSVAVQLSASRVGGLDIIAPTASTAGGGAIYRLPAPVAGVTATRDQLAQALRKADAAGATGDARRLAGAIRSLDAKSTTTATPFGLTWNPSGCTAKATPWVG